MGEFSYFLPHHHIGAAISSWLVCRYRHSLSIDSISASLQRLISKSLFLLPPPISMSKRASGKTIRAFYFQTGGLFWLVNWYFTLGDVWLPYFLQASRGYFFAIGGPWNTTQNGLRLRPGDEEEEEEDEPWCIRRKHQEGIFVYYVLIVRYFLRLSRSEAARGTSC